MNEAETRITNIDPLLKESGWDDSNNPDVPSFVREHSFTDGKINGKRIRGKAKRADYLLYYRQPQFPIAVVEAKADYKLPSDGLQQAKTYAEMLGLNFAYSTNGELFVEFDFITGWVVKSVSELCDKPQYGYTASAMTEEVGPHLLRITDIQDGSVNWETVPYCACPKPEKYILQKDDILFARTGATTGKSFLIEECPTAVFASYLIRLRVRESVTPQYLYAFFQSPSYWEQISENTIGSAQPNCNATKLTSVKVPVPPPEEQHHIVSHLENFQEKINSVKTLQAQTKPELDSFLPSFIDKIFQQAE